jgi:hypothetical protein
MRIKLHIILTVLLTLGACSNQQAPDSEKDIPFQEESSLKEEPVQDFGSTTSPSDEISAESETQTDFPENREIGETQSGFDLANVTYSPQTGVLAAEDPDSRINLRSESSLNSELKGYGLVGDEVRLLDASLSGDGYVWYFVEFKISGAKGWIRGDFIKRPDAPPDIEDIKAKATLAGLTLQEAQNILSLDENNSYGMDVKVIIPGYIPPEFEVRDIGAGEHRSFGPNYFIEYLGPGNQCFSIDAASGGFGAAPTEVELIPITSKALGSVEIELTKYDASFNGSRMTLAIEEGIIAAPQRYSFISPSRNECQMVDVEEAKKIVESLIYLNP